MDIIPREVSDVMRASIYEVEEVRRSVNNSLGYESLYDAIVHAESVGACLQGKVISENLLFIFGQTIESLSHAALELPVLYAPSYKGKDVNCYRHDEKGNCNNKSDAKNRAVIFRNFKHANGLKEFLISKEKNGRNNTQRY